MQLLADLIALWLDGEALNHPMTGRLFREAWDSEPYLEGLRAGSHFSAIAATTPVGAIWSLDEAAEDWGDDMMTSEERVALHALPAQVTAYRGGTGSAKEMAMA